MIRPKNETKYVLLSIFKNCETLNKQTHKKPEETLEFKMNKPSETFHFSPPITNKGDWMLGLTSREVKLSIFIETEENSKFERYAGPLYTELSYTTSKDKVAEVLGLSDISPKDLSHEIDGPDVFKIYRKLSIEKSQTDDFYILLKRYPQTPIF